MNGESHRSQNGQAMFTESSAKSPFAKLRFDVDSLVAPLGGAAGAAHEEQNGLRFGLPADPLMDEVLKSSPVVPAGFMERLHQVVDDLSEDTAA